MVHQQHSRTSCALLRAVLSSSWQATTQRYFVDAPVTSMDPGVEIVPPPHHVDTSTAEAASGSTGSDFVYVYPLDDALKKINVYGESNGGFSVDDSNRVIASNRLHSYDPTVLSADLRLQDYNMEESAEIVARGKEEAPIDENDAVMREGRNKQGAAGAAAVAAAMLESRRAVDGIALVPGHPLPVVFPRPDDQPPPLRFIKKFGAASGRQTSAKGSSKVKPFNDKDMYDENDENIYSDVMESEQQSEEATHSLKNTYVFNVRVLDELNRPSMVKGCHQFSELADVLPPEVQQGLKSLGLKLPTLTQSALLPLYMMGKDVLCVAPLTSGRSYAVAMRAITVIKKLKGQSSTDPLVKPRPRVLVVCPTREIGSKRLAAFKVLAGDHVSIRVAFVGPEEAKQEQTLLAEGCDLLLTTPQRLESLVSRGVVSLKDVVFAAVFAVEKILAEEGTRTALTTMLEQVKRNQHHTQFTLCCQSVSAEVDVFAKHILHPNNLNTVIVSREEERVRQQVRQVLYALKSKDERLDCVWRLYDSHIILRREQVLICCLFKETAESLVKSLSAMLEAPSSLVKCLHSGVPARHRRKIAGDFKRGDIRILVITDAAVRFDVDAVDLEHVIHYDLPPTVELLTRRVAHVGRSGRPATVHTFLSPDDSATPLIAGSISESTGKPLSKPFEAVVRQAEARGDDNNSWNTPLIRFHDHTGLTTTWRTRRQVAGGANSTGERKLGRKRESPRVASA